MRIAFLTNNRFPPREGGNHLGITLPYIDIS